MSFLRLAFAVILFGILTNPAKADHHKQTLWDAIVKDDRFATFAVLVEDAGLKHLFDERNKIPVTVYIPTNFGFRTMPEAMNLAFRDPDNKSALVKLIRSHYFLGTYQNPSDGESFLTVNIDGNQIKIANNKDLFVKDMVVKSPEINVGKSKIVPVDCVMFVQPSKTDFRLTAEQQESFAVTSCCLRTMKETAAFLQTVVW